MSGALKFDPIPTDPFYIKANHPSAFRSGQWARVIAMDMIGDPARPCYIVTFIDGQSDYWPVYDNDADYEFSKKATHG